VKNVERKSYVDLASVAAERRALLKWSSAALVGLLAFGGKLPGLDFTQALAQAGGAAMGKAVDLGDGDVGILNYAYALEQLEAAFYTQVMKTPYAGMESMDSAILTAIRDHEIAHRDFLKVALKKGAIPALEVDFSNVDFSSRDSVLSTAQTFENLGVAAYNGAGQLLKKEEYLLIAGKIVSVEARHAAAIGYLLSTGRQASASDSKPTITTGQSNNAGNMSSGGAIAKVVDDKGLDMALAPSEVLSKAGPLVKTPITADHIGSK
jgi:hypothetical protein